jgi:hypothetical protein
MNSVTLKACLYVVAVATLTSCGDPLVAPELITNTRVLAARNESVGDANRAWVMPAEAARVRWLVASPIGPTPLAWAFSACVAESVSRGLPICTAPPFARFANSGISTAEPHFDFVMPDEVNLGSATQVAIAAAFCASGTPILDASGVEFTQSTCPDVTERPLFATVNVRAALGNAMNSNPDFGRVTIQFDDVEWPVSDEAQASSADCSDPTLTLPRIAKGDASHTLGLAIPNDISESLPQITSHSAARETLNLAHFTTAGDLERAYSDVNLAIHPAPVRVSWKTPAAVAANGELVRFYFVLRDGRGGADYTQRAVCVMP